MPNRPSLAPPIRLPLCVLVALFALTGSPAYPDAGLDINTADAALLAAELPGIGPVKAARIVAHRLAHGPFPDLAALIEVPGIGPKTLERIREHLGSASTSSRPPLDDARVPDASATRSGGVPSSGDPPRSTSELEAEARAAVRAVIALARADAARRRPPDQ